MSGNYKTIVLFGPPGIGKTTQGRLLARMDGYFHFSTGEMFRDLDPNTAIGADVNSYLRGRNLIPDDLTMQLYDETIQRHIRGGSYDPEGDYLLLDGTPRNIVQVQQMNERIEVRQIIHLFSPDDALLIQRLTGRGMIEGRADDQDLAVIQRGLGVYKAETLAVLEQYDPALVFEIDGSGTIDSVHQAILEGLIRHVRSESPSKN